MNDYLAAVLFFLPAGTANMWPPIANKVPWLNRWKTPLDFGFTYKGKRITGNHKTWRGLVTGTLVGGITAVIVAWFVPNSAAPFNQFAVGLLLGFGALFGDAVESFIKRQRGLGPGQSWFPFDQLDYIIGGLLFVSLAVRLYLWVIVTIFVVYFGLHLWTSFWGYKLGLKDKPI